MKASYRPRPDLTDKNHSLSQLVIDHDGWDKAKSRLYANLCSAGNAMYFLNCQEIQKV